MVEGKSLRSFRFFVFVEENFAVEIIGTTNHLWLKKYRNHESSRIFTNALRDFNGSTIIRVHSCHSWLEKIKIGGPRIFAVEKIRICGFIRG